MKKILFILFGLLALGLIVFCYQGSLGGLPKTSVSGKDINSFIFNCVDKKDIKAVFSPGRVEIYLSDGRHLILSLAISASGARYTNQDESFVFWNKGDTAFILENDKTTFQDCLLAEKRETETSPTTQLANPASTNCSKNGGNLIIQKKTDGGEYGLCYFDDNRACEEWAMYRGDCKIGGVKTTGFDTVDQKYCAWSGGTTVAENNSICTFKNGKKCSTIDFYNGQCSTR